jgi:predicted transcriptional regulator
MNTTEAYARTDDAETAHQAAERVRCTNLEDQVYQVLLKSASYMTCLEVAEAAGMDKWSVSPRFAPLHRKGMVEPGEKIALNSAGKPRLLQAWRAIRGEA